MVSTSRAARNGLSVEEIMSMADWSNSATFKIYYFRTDVMDSFADKVYNW